MRQKEILSLLKEHGPLKNQQILGYLKEKIQPRTLREDLKNLKDQEVIAKEGKGRATIWTITENVAKHGKMRQNAAEIKNMKNRACCVDKSKKSLHCQYETRYSAEYESEGNFFCVFHDPNTKNLQKGEAIKKELRQGNYTFRYLKCEEFSFSVDDLILPEDRLCLMEETNANANDFFDEKIFVKKENKKIIFHMNHNGFHISDFLDFDINGELTEEALTSNRKELIQLIAEKVAPTLLPMLYFECCEIFRLRLMAVSIYDLSIFDCEINYIEVSDVKIRNHFILKDSRLVRSISFKGVIANLILLNQVVMLDYDKNKNIDPFGWQFNIEIRNCSGEIFRAVNCKISKEISLLESKFYKIDLRSNIFYRFPMICKETLEFSKEFNLPERCEIDYSPAINYASPPFLFEKTFKPYNVQFNLPIDNKNIIAALKIRIKNTKIYKIFYGIQTQLSQRSKDHHSNKEMNNIFFMNEYKKITNLYVFSKIKSNHFFESDYYYLLRFLAEKSGKQSCLENFFSRIYRRVSDYGENIQKSFLWLLLISALFSIIYFLSLMIFNRRYGLESENYLLMQSVIMSLSQIVKPFSLMRDSTHLKDIMISFLSFFNSIIALPLMAILILALTRRFRNK